MSTININTRTATKTLVSQGALSKTAGESLTVTSGRDVEVPDLSALTTDPTFACFLIDASGSMESYRDDVIDGQSLAINTLRGSGKCKLGALFVVQYLFSDHVEVLNPFTILSASGKDRVKILDRNSYNPQHGTALYQSLFHMLQDMAANLAHAEQMGVRASFTVGLITDGKDTEKGIDPADIKKVTAELHSRKYLLSSVILGLTNQEFTNAMLEELRVRLGFQSAIPLSRSGHDIRQAFLLGSQAAASASAAR